jgi:hypothetical protein
MASAAPKSVFISSGVFIGPSAWSSSDFLRPSHMNCVLYAVFTTVGVARPSTVPLMPTPVGRPSDQPRAGLWQVPQESVPLPDRRGSKNSALPSSMRSGVLRLSAGSGGAPSSQTRSCSGAGASSATPAANAITTPTTSAPARAALRSELHILAPHHEFETLRTRHAAHAIRMPSV